MALKRLPQGEIPSQMLESSGHPGINDSALSSISNQVYGSNEVPEHVYDVLNSTYNGCGDQRKPTVRSKAIQLFKIVGMLLLISTLISIVTGVIVYHITNAATEDKIRITLEAKIRPPLDTLTNNNSETLEQLMDMVQRLNISIHDLQTMQASGSQDVQPTPTPIQPTPIHHPESMAKVSPNRKCPRQKEPAKKADQVQFDEWDKRMDSFTNNQSQILDSLTDLNHTLGAIEVKLNSSVECPDTWLTYQGSCYLFKQNMKMNFLNAENYCRQHKGHLVRVDSAQENNFIKDYLKQLGGRIHWMGLTDMNSEGTWLWYDTKKPPTFTGWYQNQPDDGSSGQDCAVFHHNMYYNWDDIQCSYSYEPICEIRLM